MEREDIVLKLLHTADWHLGRPFRSFPPEAAARLMRARLEVLHRVLGEAERNQVHAVLCAGDLFDEPAPAPHFRDAFLELLRNRAWPEERPLFLLPGNHDPLVAGSLWRDAKFRAALPKWARVVDVELLEVQLTADAVLYAVPCQSSAGQKDPTSLIPPRAPGDTRIRVGLAHGSTWELADAQTNFPIAPDAVVSRGLDYLAIGDTHGFRFVPPERRHPPTIYPGTPEQTSFGERDAGHVALVFINRQRRALVEKAPVAQWHWEELTVSSLLELKALTQRRDLDRRVLRLTVAARLDAEGFEEAERLLTQLAGTPATQGLVGVLELDRERLSLDVTSIADAVRDLPAVLQAAATKLTQAAADEAQRAVAERALLHLLRLARAG
jgi:DNA repair exonuclease SbcCD nuclease subunit